MNSIYQIIGKNIFQLRDKKGLSQVYIASQINMTRASISQIEKGTQRVSIDTLYKITSVLDCLIYDVLPARADIEVDADTIKKLDLPTIQNVLQELDKALK